MNVMRAKKTLRKQMTLAYSELNSTIAKIASGCDIRPSSAQQVFEIEQVDDASMKVIVKPVAFRLKETAKSTNAEMFVTVTGKLNFSISAGMEPPLACFFNTTVGYFKLHGRILDHVLGLRYDFDPHRAAHPIFHAQIQSCASDIAIINEHYQPSFVTGKDLMKDVAQKVRLPTAHMDPLAVFVQLLADHLMKVGSGPEESSAFERARSALMFFNSDPAKAERLNDAVAHSCFRGPRWYPRAPPSVPPVP